MLKCGWKQERGVRVGRLPIASHQQATIIPDDGSPAAMEATALLGISVCVGGRADDLHLRQP